MTTEPEEPELPEPCGREEPHYCFFTDAELGTMYREIQADYEEDLKRRVIP